MDNESCGKSYLSAFLFLVSLIVGGIVALLFFFFAFPLLIFVLPAVIGIAIIFLIVSIALMLSSAACDCKKAKYLLRSILIGSIATIILDIIGIAVAIIPFNIISAIIVFLIATAFVFTVLVFVYFIRCLFLGGRRFS